MNEQYLVIAIGGGECPTTTVCEKSELLNAIMSELYFVEANAPDDEREWWADQLAAEENWNAEKTRFTVDFDEGCRIDAFKINRTYFQAPGDWMQTFTGKKWFVTDPHPDDVEIRDIAHGLSMVCRFAGHCRVFYSVAEHSVRVARLVEACGGTPEEALWGLLHDAAEAYLGDMVRPLKVSMTAYREHEARHEGVILKGLGVAAPTTEARKLVKTTDDILLVTEQRDLMGVPPEAWSVQAEPLDVTIEPWTATQAEAEFLARYRVLRMLCREGGAV